jgi:hypothetical protein
MLEGNMEIKVGDLVLEAVEKRAREVRPPLMGVVLAISKSGYHYHIQWTNGNEAYLGRSMVIPLRKDRDNKKT